MGRLDDYISASGISTDKFVNGSRNFVNGLINFGFLHPVFPSQNISRDKLIALYPRSGGNVTSNSINLVNPSKYNLITSGGYTHDMFGSLPDGTTGYCDTGLNMLSRMANYKMAIGYLCGSNVAPGAGENRFLFGVNQGTTQTSINNFATNQQQAFGTGARQITVNPITNFQKFFFVTCSGDSQMSLIGDDVPLAADNTTLTIDRHADATLYLDALNNGGTAQYFNNNKCNGLVLLQDASVYDLKIIRRLFLQFKAEIS